MSEAAGATQATAGDDATFWAAFEAERARVLRRRMVWSLGVLLGLVALSVLGTMFEVQEVREGKPTPPEYVLLGVMEDVTIASLLVATLLYVRGAKPDRRRLVGMITLSTVALMAVATGFEILRGQMYPSDFHGDVLPPGAVGESGVDPGVFAARWALLAHGVILTIPLVLLPMRLVESARIAAVCVVVYVLLVGLVGKAGVGTVLAYGSLAAAACVPGMAFSAWRFGRFDAKFRHEELKGRLGELSTELGHARRLHEALFPAPIETGPVRVRFAYEPMREIGGDYVFVHSTGDVVHVVLIDVSGHGVPAALAVNRLQGELMRMFAAERGLTADRVMELLNAYVYLTLAPQGVFATAVAMKVWGEGAGFVVEWSDAGHPPALVRRAGEAGELVRLEPTTTMLGVLGPELFAGLSRRVELAAGDVVVAYTDGVTETRDAEGVEFGVRVEEVVRASRGDVAVEVVKAAARFRGGRVRDDVLVVEVGVG